MFLVALIDNERLTASCPHTWTYTIFCSPFGKKNMGVIFITA
jgi:hypothetical protein